MPRRVGVVEPEIEVGNLWCALNRYLELGRSTERIGQIAHELEVQHFLIDDRLDQLECLGRRIADRIHGGDPLDANTFRYANDTLLKLPDGTIFHQTDVATLKRQS